jgi:hypothetical protein
MRQLKIKIRVVLKIHFKWLAQNLAVATRAKFYRHDGPAPPRGPVLFEKCVQGGDVCEWKSFLKIDRQIIFFVRSPTQFRIEIYVYVLDGQKIHIFK